MYCDPIGPHFLRRDEWGCKKDSGCEEKVIQRAGRINPYSAIMFREGSGSVEASRSKSSNSVLQYVP